MALERLSTISPTTNRPVVERTGLSDAELKALPGTAAAAFESYRKVPLAERQAIVKKALQLLASKQDELARELTEQMGRPISYTASEIKTAVARGEYLLKISDDALSDTPGESERGFQRFIRKTPVGPVLILFAWNVCNFLLVMEGWAARRGYACHLEPHWPPSRSRTGIVLPLIGLFPE